MTFHYLETMYNGNRVDFKVVTNTKGSLSGFTKQSIRTEYTINTIKYNGSKSGYYGSKAKAKLVNL